MIAVDIFLETFALALAEELAVTVGVLASLVDSFHGWESNGTTNGAVRHLHLPAVSNSMYQKRFVAYPKC